MIEEKKLNILIVDDHELFRSGLRALLKHLPHIGEIYEAGDGLEGIQVADSAPLDLILMDIQMPGMDGFEATKQIIAKYPSIIILVLSMRDDHSSVIEILSYGAKGYLFKNSGFNDLKQAIHQVMNGKQYVQKEIEDELKTGFSQQAFGIMPLRLKDIIHGQERMVLELLCDGLNMDEISKKLKIGKRTIEGIKNRLFLKTGTTSTGRLISYSFKNGLVKF